METDLSENTPTFGTSETTSGSSDEASGRWIRDQLRDVADSGLKNLETAVSPVTAEPENTEAAPAETAAEESPSVETPPEPQVGSDPAPMTDLVEGLAASISSAVAAPIRNLEQRRSAEHAAVESALREQENAGRESRERIESLAEQLRLLDEAVTSGSRRADEAGAASEALAARVAEIEGADLRGGLDETQKSVSDLAARLDSAERAMRAQAEIIRSLEESERKRKETAEHLADLLDRMRETVLTMKTASTPEPTNAEEPAHNQEAYAGG